MRLDERSVLNKKLKRGEDEKYAEISSSDKTIPVERYITDKPFDAAQEHLCNDSAPNTTPKSTSDSFKVDLTSVAIDERETKEVTPVCKSTRDRKKPSRWVSGTALLKASDDTPFSFTDAVSRPESEAWTKAMKIEH